MNYDQAKTVRFRAGKERQMLTEVARRVARKESEVLRILVRGAYEALAKEGEQENTDKVELHAA